MNSLGAHGNGFDKGGRGPSGCIAYVDASGLWGGDAEGKKEKVQGAIAGYAQSLAGSALSEDALKEIFGVQADLIVNDKGAYGILRCKN